MPYAALLHTHVSSWSLALVLFIIALFLLKAGKLKGVKVLQMISRLFYVIILVTGVALLAKIQFPVAYIVKGILAIWVIYSMEMLLVRGSKGLLNSRQKTILALQFIIALILVLAIGYGWVSF